MLAASAVARRHWARARVVSYALGWSDDPGPAGLRRGDRRGRSERVLCAV